MEKLSAAMEDYLKAIYELCSKGVGARVSDIAERMAVSKASVIQAMNVLEGKGLITKGEHKERNLTSKGKRQVKLISNKHTIIHQFLTEVLKVDPVIADLDACSFEHTISLESLSSIDQYLRQHTQRKWKRKIGNE
jgi:DtxR family Mn-dependent transcriptional regulator